MENIKKQVERMQEIVNNLDQYADVENCYYNLEIGEVKNFIKEVHKLVINFDELTEYIRNNH